MSLKKTFRFSMQFAHSHRIVRFIVEATDKADVERQIAFYTEKLGTVEIGQIEEVVLVVLPITKPKQLPTLQISRANTTRPAWWRRVYQAIWRKYSIAMNVLARRAM